MRFWVVWHEVVDFYWTIHPTTKKAYHDAHTFHLEGPLSIIGFSYEFWTIPIHMINFGGPYG
jgi:hypothetical protein